MTRIYLDYNATCPIRPEVVEAVAGAMAHTGNASSIHGDGRAARKMVEDARGALADFVNVRPAQVIFNSGATEGNNTILSGYQDKKILIGATEHPSIIEAAPNAQTIPVDKNGVIDLAALDALLENAPALIAVQFVNSETGVIQPIADIAARAKAKGALVLCDAVQAAGRLPLDFKSLGVDFMTLSAHKFGGPQGIGALIFREGQLLPKLLRGGGQEKRQRAGTENVAAIAGFGVAAQMAFDARPTWDKHCRALQEKLETGLRQIANDIVIVSAGAPRVANTSNILLPGISAETQLMAMDLAGVSVSSGSACSSGAFKASHVLTAMGYDEAASKSALRFSLGWATTDADIEKALEAYETMTKRIR